MVNKGFKYIETKRLNKSTKIILESKHKRIQIIFDEYYSSDRIEIYIKDKKTNQNKNYYFYDLKDNSLPKKYINIISQYIIMYKL